MPFIAAVLHKIKMGMIFTAKALNETKKLHKVVHMTGVLYSSLLSVNILDLKNIEHNSE